jgi:potassium voltage-gated channel Shaw-related subfamily C protein 1
MFLIISIFNFVFETSSFCRVPYDVSSNMTISRRDRNLNTSPHPSMKIIESICNYFFAIEFLFRIVTAPSKWKFVRNPYHLLEFLAISPLFFPKEKHVHSYIQVFYILRILRIFTLVPKYSGLRILLLTLRNSIGELFLYLALLLMSTLLFASFIYYAEQMIEDENNKFDSILISIWWALVTSGLIFMVI